ncbi:hypothetical protein D9M68_771800 [compost metagenome]
MLDHQDAAVDRHAADQGGDAGHILLAQPRHRFVQQHDFRFQRQGHGDFQRALAAIGQQGGGGVRQRGQADRIQQFHRAPIQAVDAAAAAPEAPAVAMLAHQRHAHVLQDRKPQEHRGDLEGADDPQPRDLFRRQRRDVAAAVVDDARIRRQEFGQQVETGGFACAIGADEGMDGAFAQGQGHVVDGIEAAEPLDQPPGGQDRLGIHGSAPTCGPAGRRRSPGRAR